jgi:prepilin-type N-terminal cleavage/methylation domain-containing protein
MLRRKGFTLIELMVVILIVAILAAVAIPIMRGRIDAAKWSEGKAMMGTIATAIRAYSAEKGADWTGTWPTGNDLAGLGFKSGDLTGNYFKDACFAYTITKPTGTAGLGFSVACDATKGQTNYPTSTPTTITMTGNTDGTVTWSN